MVQLELVRYDGVVVSRCWLMTALNRAWAKGWFGADGGYWDADWQLRLEPTPGGWLVVPNLRSVNATLLDGVVLNSAAVLLSGAKLALGPDVARMKTPFEVRFI